MLKEAIVNGFKDAWQIVKDMTWVEWLIVIVTAVLLTWIDPLHAAEDNQIYVPGTSTVPGAYLGIRPYTGWAMVSAVSTMYRCPIAKYPDPGSCSVIGFQVSADHVGDDGKRYRYIGISNRRVSVGEQVKVNNGAIDIK